MPLTPYNGSIDSAAAYFSMLAWYVQQTRGLYFSEDAGGIRLAVFLETVGENDTIILPGPFHGNSPQQCLMLLHSRVVEMAEWAGNAGSIALE